MKKLLLMLTILFVSTVILSACNDEKDKPNGEEDSGENLEETIEGSNNEDNDTDKSDDKSTEEDDSASKETDDSSKGEKFETETEDQLELSIGDTGKFDSDLTTYEITLDDAEIIEEIDGEQSLADSFILLDLTVKNTGEETYSVEDLLYGLEVTDNPDSSGYQDYSEEFESVEQMTGELAPGEEMSGQYITEIYKSDVYYFRLRSGIAASGSSNQVTWVIPVTDVK